MTILASIGARKAKEVAQRKRMIPESVMANRAADAPAARGFVHALERSAGSGFALVAEIKKASPSKGIIREDFDPVALARGYAAGGATAISILTDGPSFSGSLKDLADVRKTVDLPLLRKDFMLEPYQVYEARAHGADCILVIMALVGDEAAASLIALARELGMDALIEIHDEAELERALRLDSPLIGINNRNLRTFEVTLETTEKLARLIPEDRQVVAESGIFTHADLQALARCGVRRFLVGESLMRQPDVTRATRSLLGVAPDAEASRARLTHFDRRGQAHMVDISAKPVTSRKAIARGAISMNPETLRTVADGSASKGDVLAVARLAGIMGAKGTSNLIPLCHPLPLTKVSIDFRICEEDGRIEIEAVASASHRTGVEMEALTAVSVSALTIYDMTKSIDKSMEIGDIRLVYKEGGKSGTFVGRE